MGLMDRTSTSKPGLSSAGVKKISARIKISENLIEVKFYLDKIYVYNKNLSLTPFNFLFILNTYYLKKKVKYIL